MSDPISDYFAQYPTFNYRPSATDWRQIGAFNALASHCRWSQNHRRDQFDEFKQTWYNVVEREFGESSLPHYQSLCRDLRIAPVPDSITGCKASLSSVFVNIVDLMQYRHDRNAGRWAEPARLFESLEDLQEYSEKERKWYPKQSAKAEMLRELLKVLQ
jgi:hypothetical protein